MIRSLTVVVALTVLPALVTGQERAVRHEDYIHVRRTDPITDVLEMEAIRTESSTGMLMVVCSDQASAFEIWLISKDIVWGNGPVDVALRFDGGDVIKHFSWPKRVWPAAGVVIVTVPDSEAADIIARSRRGSTLTARFTRTDRHEDSSTFSVSLRGFTDAVASLSCLKAR